MNDIEVLRRVRAGNTKAYEELVVKYEKRIFQVALGLLRDEQDALDATQEVFIKAFLRVANFRHESEYYTYLFRIAVNECKDVLSRRARRRTVPLYREDDTPIELPAAEEGLPELMAARTSSGRRCMRKCSVWKNRFARRYCCCSVYQLSYERIAAETDTDIGTVKSRIYRGRERIRKSLAARNLL